MKTNKELIDSLFFEAVDFANNTPASKSNKYEKYSKSVAKSFSRLVKGIDDPEELSLINEFINTDFYLNTDLMLTRRSGYDEANLRINYEKIKRLILDRIEMPKEKNEKQLADFFFNIENKSEFLSELKETFTTEKGIDFSILMHLLKDDNLLIIGNREFAGFHRLSESHFNRNIGATTAINDTYKHTINNQEIYKPNIEIIENKLKPLILKYKV